VLLTEGAVAVSYDGCEMRVLDACRVEGEYRWSKTTLAHNRLEIDNTNDLYAKIPLGAVDLEGELEASGRLAIALTVPGQMRLRDEPELPDSPKCADATHIVSAVSIGAFELKSGGSLGVKAGVKVGTAGAGVKHASKEKMLSQAGEADTCKDATEEAPPADCRSPLQVFLTRVERQRASAYSSGRAESSRTREQRSDRSSREREQRARQQRREREQRARQGRRARPAKKGVTVHFAAPEGAEGKWSVVDKQGRPLCDVPCVREVGEKSGLKLQREAARKADVKTVPLPDDLGYTAGRSVRAQPRFGGASLVTPIVLTAVGGAAGIVGGVLAGVYTVYEEQRDSSGKLIKDEKGEVEKEVNCSLSANEAACTAGLPVMAGGIITALVGGIWWFVAASSNSAGKMDVTLIEGDSASLSLAPNGVVGRF